ncbi:MAG: putative Na+/H+ antiporter [Burkholderiaceae bacterium]
MLQANAIEIAGAALFAVAVLHTFSTKWFEHLAHIQPRHAGLWHLLGEVEVVFGFWALVLVAFMAATAGPASALSYLQQQDFTEPLFVFAILVIAGTRPVLCGAQRAGDASARRLPLAPQTAGYVVCLSVVPLLGSFITEPAAMTLAALMLRDRYFGSGMPEPMKYATLAVLLVNVSIGGVLTPYAAPPVLMVAGTWGWGPGFMSSTFGWKAAVAVVTNAAVLTWLFRRALATLPPPADDAEPRAVPLPVVLIHLAFLAATVLTAHYPVVFIGLFLFFLGFTDAYRRHQDPLMLREGLLVAFFLAGLVVLGGQQRWWLQPVLAGMDATLLFFGATALTAVTDNAALTYLGSLVQGIADPAKYALVAGAVTGGGLTVIANAPNPAGFAILGERFNEQSIHPGGLFVAALLPTAAAACCFLFL